MLNSFTQIIQSISNLFHMNSVYTRYGESINKSNILPFHYFCMYCENHFNQRLKNNTKNKNIKNAIRRISESSLNLLGRWFSRTHWLRRYICIPRCTRRGRPPAWSSAGRGLVGPFCACCWRLSRWSEADPLSLCLSVQVSNPPW